MTTWNKLHKIARYNVAKNRKAIDRSRRNNANGGKRPKKQGGRS